MWTLTVDQVLLTYYVRIERAGNVDGSYNLRDLAKPTDLAEANISGMVPSGLVVA